MLGAVKQNWLSLHDAANELGAERDVVDGLGKPALQEKLVGLGAADVVAAEAVEELYPVVQELRFRSADDVMGMYQRLFEAQGLGGIPGALQKPAFLKKRVCLGAA